MNFKGPVRLRHGWAFMDAQETPFWYAFFATKQDAIKAMKIYLEATKCKK